jgi:hypothetical protein
VNTPTNSGFKLPEAPAPELLTPTPTVLATVIAATQMASNLLFPWTISTPPYRLIVASRNAANAATPIVSLLGFIGQREIA